MRLSSRFDKIWALLLLFCVSVIAYAAYVVEFDGAQVVVQNAIIYTPNGSVVYVQDAEESLSQTEKNNRRTVLLRDYPSSEILGEATTTYNCHGYAWSVVDGLGTYIMNTGTGNLSNFWGDYSYYETTAANAEKIVYDFQDHSAVKSTGGKYISKWGAGCLVKHSPTATPYSASRLRYYAKTPAMSGSNILGNAHNQTYQIASIPSGLTLSWSYDTNLFSRVSASGNSIVLKPKTTSVTGVGVVAAQLSNSSGVLVGRSPLSVYVNRLPPISASIRVVRSSDGAEVYPSGSGLSPDSYYYAYISGVGGYNITWQPDSHAQILSSSNSMLYFKTDSQGWTILRVNATDQTTGVTQKILDVTLYGSY